MLNSRDNAKSMFTKQLTQKLIDHIVDEPAVVAIASQLISEAIRKLDFKLTKQLQIKEKDMKDEFTARLKNVEDGLKKEMSYFTLHTSLKKGIDDSMLKRSPSFVPSPQPGLDEMQVIKLCKETFADEYAKRMVQYHMDLTQEIDEVERAKVLLKDETESNRNGIMQAITPLQVMTRLSLRTVEKTHIATRSGGLDEYSRVHLSNLDKSQMSIVSHN